MFSKWTNSPNFQRVPQGTEEEEKEKLLAENIRFLTPSIRSKLLTSGAIGAFFGFFVAVILSLWIPPFKYAYGKNAILKQVSWPCQFILTPPPFGSELEANSCQQLRSWMTLRFQSIP